MADPMKLLSDDEVAEIEARANAVTPRYCVDWEKGRHALLQDRGWRSASEEQPRTIATFDRENGYLGLLFCAEARTDIPALCAAVRTLRQQNQELKAIVDIGTSDDPGTALAKVHRIQDEATTALREQLAQRDQFLSDSAETEDRCRDLLAAYDQSSAEGVVPLDEVVRLVVGQLAHWQDRTRERTGEVERLQSELAQVTRERQLCLQVQKRGIHSSVMCPCVIAMEASNESPQP